jgi:hypothetical protein
VPKINQKNEKKGCFERKMGFGLVGDKTGNLGIWVAGGGYGWWRTAGGGVLVVGKVAVGGGCGWFLDLGRRVTEEGFRGVYTAGWEKWGRGGGEM